MSRRVLLIGRNGQLGFELNQILSPFVALTAVDADEIDLTKPSSIRSMVSLARPDIILNAAAYTDVEKAEAEPEMATAINGEAPGILAAEAKSLGAGIVHYSTDYVFDGTKRTPYLEEDTPAPLSAYGRSKLAGEVAIRSAGVPHLILRTTWLYGARGRNFLLTILRLAENREELRVVDDQVGAPTWSRSLAEVTLKMLVQLNWDLPPSGGTYHVTAQGSTSWCGFARETLSLMHESKLRDVRVIPISTSEYPTKARRPLNSLLSNQKLFRDFGLSMPNWEEDLAEVIARLGQENAGGAM